MYQRYFGSIRPNELKRPVLGEELNTVRKWIDPLKTSSHKELQELSVALETIVKDSDAAVIAHNKASEAMKTFRIEGDRAVLFEKINAARKSTYGELSKRSHDLVDKKASDFANQFFMRTRGKKRPDPVSAEQLKTRIEDTQNMLNDLQEQYAVLQNQEDAKTKLKDEYEAELKRIADAQKAMEASAKKAAELKDKLGKDAL